MYLQKLLEDLSLLEQSAMSNRDTEVLKAIKKTKEFVEEEIEVIRRDHLTQDL